MRQNGRFSGINFLAGVVASILLLAAFGSTVANAQRRLADDSDIFKAQKKDQEPNPITAQKGIGNQGRKPGGAPAGVNVRAEAAQPQSPLAPLAPPISNCVDNGGSHNCNIYQTDGAGNPSDITQVINLPNVVVGGYLVIKLNGALPDSDMTNWSAVIKFGDGSNNNTTIVQGFFRGCNTGNPNDISCFDPYSPGTSAFVVESNPGPTVFFSAPNTYNIFSSDSNPVTRPWTTAGSTGQTDEDSTTIIRYNLFGANLVAGATGSAHIRYNITAVQGISSQCPATLSTIRTRFRNSDTTGAVARLTYEIRTSSINAGGNTVIYTFDSNGRGNGSAFRTATDTNPIDFNFATNMYWIEATIFRSDPNAFSDLGSIAILGGRWDCLPVSVIERTRLLIKAETG